MPDTIILQIRHNKVHITAQL